MITDSKNNPAPINHIAICGGGLAGHMTAAALASALPPAVKITLLRGGDAPDTDLFYGNVTAPSAYAFNLNAGLAEPKLILQGDAAFSWGTKYAHWAGGSRSWIQSFHLALPVIDGVQFHHYLAQQGVTKLEPFLVSAVAGRNGAFAHPPQSGPNPLSRAEYGYQFDPFSYASLFDSCLEGGRVQKLDATVAGVERSEAGVGAIRCSDGQTLKADLYVDCSGPGAVLLSALGSAFSGNRRLGAAMSAKPADRLGPPLRTVTAAAYGWRAETPVRGRLLQQTVYDPDMTEEALAAHGGPPERAAAITLGRRQEAWSGNCVGIGQAISAVEPLTPAPVMLLQNDIERLLSLIPFSNDHSMERREYNRRGADDYEHAELFTRALFETEGLPDSPYWRAARAGPIDERLARKLELFSSRGLLVAYDLEPFNPEDWTILHFGMGRRSAHHDRTADRAQPGRVQQYLATMKNEIQNTAKSMPDHDSYMRDLARHLMQKKL